MHGVDENNGEDGEQGTWYQLYQYRLYPEVDAVNQLTTRIQRVDCAVVSLVGKWNCRQVVCYTDDSCG